MRVKVWMAGTLAVALFLTVGCGNQNKGNQNHSMKGKAPIEHHEDD